MIKKLVIWNKDLPQPKQVKIKCLFGYEITHDYTNQDKYTTKLLIKNKFDLKKPILVYGVSDHTDIDNYGSVYEQF